MIPMLDYYKDKWQVASERSIKPGLFAMQEALSKIGHPEQRLAVIHFAGTNGKGSTLTFLEQMLRHHGIRVGKFMSPCIIDVHDQIQVDGKPITTEEMDAVFQHLQQSGVTGQLTDFELLTCAAFVHFVHTDVEIVLLEAGMGGLEDSTNVILPIMSIIPSIALEHTKFLGNTLTSIAHHKAGIIKYGKPVVIGRLPQEALAVVTQEAHVKKAPLLALGKHFDVSGERYTNRLLNLQVDGLKRTLPGQHQGDNMALALTAFFHLAELMELQPSAKKLQDAVVNTQVPGRFEEVLPSVFFDGAHNPASAEKLAETIREKFAAEPVEIIFGMLADKDIEQVLQILKPVAKKFYLIDFANERAMDAVDVQKIAGDMETEVITDCLPLLRSAEQQQITRIVTGSLYLLTEIRQQLAN